MKKSKGFLIMAIIFFILSIGLPILAVGFWVSLILATINYYKEKKELREVKQNG
jgi:preprotein translocase subunit SecG